MAASESSGTLPDKSRAKYLVVNALVRRMRDLQEGAKPLVNRPSTDLADVAVEEFRQGKVHMRPGRRGKDSASESKESEQE